MDADRARDQIAAGDQGVAAADNLTADARIEVERRRTERRRGNQSDTPKLRCPKCGEYLSRVVDTFVAGTPAAPVVRRRRRCENPACRHTFPTVESVIDAA